MKKRLGKRIVTEHGLVSNVLPGLTLVDQVAIASLTKRTYEVTVPWNSSALMFPKLALEDYPNLYFPNNTSSDQIQKIDTQVSGEEGQFYGMVNEKTGLASGHGVFLAGEWIHCGSVEKDIFIMGRKVSANKSTGELQLLSWK